MAPKPSRWSHGGVPLFWCESKSTPFWEALLDMFDIKRILDLTPGRGALARAAVSRGNKYGGVVGADKHLAWLQEHHRHSLLALYRKGGALVPCGRGRADLGALPGVDDVRSRGEEEDFFSDEEASLGRGLLQRRGVSLRLCGDLRV